MSASSRSSLLLSLLAVSWAPACAPLDQPDEPATIADWVELCESQASAVDCEAVPPGEVEGQHLRCESLIIVVVADAPDCYSQANDSRCLAVGDAPGAPGYILDEDGTRWLVEAPAMDPSVFGSAITACDLDGAVDPMCACAGMVTDDPGAP